MKQIEACYIVKIQAATMRFFEAVDKDYPDGRAVFAHERAIQKWLEKITDDEDEQLKILCVIERENWNREDKTFKPIFDELRKLGYEIVEGTKQEMARRGKMAKCGKGCMPECECFTTGGCVSPFNCPYKIENESITTATSTPCNLYPLETDKDAEISRLQAENAELRERLDKAGELPCEMGDTLIIEADKLPEGCVPRFYCSVGGKEIDITEYVREETMEIEKEERQ